MLNWMWWMPRPPVRPDTTRTLDINLNHNLVVSGKLEVMLIQPSPSPLAGVWMTITSGLMKVDGRLPMSYTLPVGMQISLQISYVDGKGNPAEVDGDTTWTSSDDTISTVTVDPSDSTKATVVSVDLGQSQITSHADADLGEGTRDIIGTLDIQVVAGEAVTAQITPVGEPQPTPDDPNAPQVNPLSRSASRTAPPRSR